jgi:hypothetical protein
LLAAHPETLPHRGHGGKELHFFDRFAVAEFTEADLRAYHALFPRPADGVHQTGEWTPRYMYDFWVPPLLARCAPQARFLILLRDPMQRFASGVRRNVTAWGFAPANAVHDALARSRYHEQLSRLLRHIPRDRLLILQYERCTAEARSQLRRTFEFLEFQDVAFVPPQLNESNERPPAVQLDPAVSADVEQLARESLRDDVAALVRDFGDMVDASLWSPYQ